MWDVEKKQKLPFEFKHESEINDLAFTPDGDHLVSASDDNNASLWDVNSGEKLRDFPHDSRVNRVLALDGNRVVTGCEDGTATLWNFESEEPVKRFFHRRPVKSLATNDEQNLIAVGTGEPDHLWSDIEANGTVRVWDLENRYEVSGPWPHDGPIQELLFAQHKPHVLTASGSARQNTAVHPGAVRAWQYILPTVVSTTPEFPNVQQEPVTTVTLSNGVQLSHGNNIDINQYALNTNAEIVATASKDQSVRLWSSVDGSPASNPLLLDGSAEAVAFNSDGSLIATASRPTDDHSVVQVWEVSTGYPITPPLPCPDLIEELTFSSQGGALFAKGAKQKYRWSLRKNEEGEAWARHIPQRLRVRLDERGSVVPN